MKYDNITKATFLTRPNRFIAEVEVNGKREVVHVKNTGRCRELLIPGCEVWLNAPGTPGRKTKYDLVAVRKSNGLLFNIDSQAPNKVVKEWLATQDYDRVIPEYTYGNSRIDFYMEKSSSAEKISTVGKNPIAEKYPAKESGEDFKKRMGNRDDLLISLEKGLSESHFVGDDFVEKYLMEVKGCTLEIDGVGYFPDAPTERGVKHIRELIKAREAGYHAALAFVIQMDGVKEVRPNVDTHPEFGVAMEEARAAGVEVLFLTCHVEPGELIITGCKR